MSFFDKIKDAIFGPAELDKRTAPKGTPGSAQPRTAPTGTAQPTGTAPRARQPQPAPQPQATTVVNVENSLDSMPGADRLNWRTSIVDLMKLINVDSDYESRKALAAEMGRTDYSGETDDNVWLHQRVMQELASNGGEVPASLR